MKTSQIIVGSIQDCEFYNCDNLRRIHKTGAKVFLTLPPNFCCTRSAAPVHHLYNYRKGFKFSCVEGYGALYTLFFTKIKHDMYLARDRI